MQFAIIGAIVSALGFGLANIVIKKALNNTSIAQTLLGSMLSGVFFLVLLVLFNGFTGNISWQMIVTLAILAIGEVALYLSLYKALEVSDVTVAVGIINTYPIVSTIVAILFLHEAVHFLTIVYILLLVFGAILISIDWADIKLNKFNKQSFSKGLPWALLSLLIHSIYFPSLGNVTSSGNWEIKLLIVKIFASIILFTWFVLIKRSKFVLTKNKILAGILLGLLEVVGWIGLSYASSNSIGLIAVIVALGSSAPLVTAIVARIYLKEKLHPFQYLGIIIVVVGLTLIALG